MDISGLKISEESKVQSEERKQLSIISILLIVKIDVLSGRGRIGHTFTKSYIGHPI